MRRSIWIPAGVCKSQSMAAEASRTINEPHALRELRRLYPAASVPVHAASSVRATLPRWGGQRSRAFPRASSPKATSRSSQPGPLKHDAVCPERFVPGSSLPCQQHTFMCGTCQVEASCYHSSMRHMVVLFIHFLASAYRKVHPARMLLKSATSKKVKRGPPLHNSGCHNVTLR